MKSTTWGIIFCAVIVSFTTCEIISSRNSVISPLADPVYFKIPKYSPKDAPHSSPGNGRSYIDTGGLEFHLYCDKDKHPQSQTKGYGSYDESKDDCGLGSTSLDLLMFRVPDEGENWMDYWVSGLADRTFCCTAKMVEDGKCKAANEDKLIVPSEISDILARRTITVDSKSTGSSFGKMDETNFDITVTGVYIILLGVCTPFENSIMVEGTIDVMEPYGYLPADFRGDLPFYEVLAVVYTIMGFLWMVICVIYSDELISVQHYITLVIFLGMVETSILYSHYLNWNDYGTPYASMSLQVTAILFGVLKRAASRVLVLIVALGYGVLKPTLGADGISVGFLTVGYVALSFTSDISAMQTYAASVTERAAYSSTLVAAGLAVIDTIFYLWIFSALEKTLKMLEIKQLSVKLLLYSRFSTVLVCSLIFSIGWVLYSSLFILYDPAESFWPYHWAVDGLWEVAYLVILMSMMILWAPYKNSNRFAYSPISHMDDDEKEDVSGANGVELSAVSTGAISSVRKKKVSVSPSASPTHTRTPTTRRRQDEEDLNQEYGNVLEDSFPTSRNA